MMVRLAIFLAAAVVVLGSCAGTGTDRVVVASGTTLVDSGFIELVVSAYESESQALEISVVGLGSVEALAYAEAGNADVTITHEPQALAAFLASHPDATSMVPFASEFVLVGPSGFEAGADNAVDLFRRIAASRFPFVSRDDGSGTHAREQIIWAAVPYAPGTQEWYVRTGSGMASTLLIASQRSAVTLAELGAYMTVSAELSLVEIPVESRTMLDNPYDLTVVDSTDPASAAFGLWLAGPSGVEAIEAANEQLFGMQVYRVP